MARKKELDDEKVLQDIYNAAVEVLSEDGIDGLSIRKVCAKADISIGTFYNFYPTKQHLLERLLDHMENFYKNTVVPDLSGSGTDKLYTISKAHVDRVIRFGVDYARKTLDFMNNSTFVSETHDRQYRTQVFIAVAQECIDNGEIKSGYTAKELAYSALSICRGLAASYVYLNGDVDINKLTDDTLKIFINGLKT